ncbi:MULTISPECIES: hypothetical protein [Leptospirillum]|jgi:hypothetical protein|uniref:Lipoprotein n=2 Tax=Leptospirillum ferriphilum TaxID=178606 RepID=A0A059XXR0_9BACT|nr:MULTISPECIES: hypothetical protein [Leptospirillum]EAY56772.1 MAG: protein of unknown function [Leptospirillum rubarum]EIJ76695.1 MAG: hypothetical protein C75L2_00380060 [Leptospirillum sp. Group II 'C75']MCL4405797.1 hypothetical protein [Bacillota bacterium]MCL5259865.1 hypothetical protein [Nitrospirota bacterium]AIA31895.1 hypothetical protein Y981_09775 [Leptospirillum ferriphilum YSK]
MRPFSRRETGWETPGKVRGLGGLLLGLGLFFLASCSTGPQPPVFIDMSPGLTFPPVSGSSREPVPVAVLPVKLRGDSHNVGILFHATGGTSPLLVNHSLKKSVLKSLKAVLKANGYKPYDASSDHHELIVRMEVVSFEDRIRANLLHVRQKAVLKCRYILIRQSGEKSTRIVKTSKREESPTPAAVFDQKSAGKLLEKLLKSSLEKDLIPTLNDLVKQES